MPLTRAHARRQGAANKLHLQSPPPSISAALHSRPLPFRTGPAVSGPGLIAALPAALPRRLVIRCGIMGLIAACVWRGGPHCGGPRPPGPGPATSRLRSDYMVVARTALCLCVCLCHCVCVCVCVCVVCWCVCARLVCACVCGRRARVYTERTVVRSLMARLSPPAALKARE